MTVDLDVIEPFEGVIVVLEQGRCAEGMTVISHWRGVTVYYGFRGA